MFFIRLFLWVELGQPTAISPSLRINGSPKGEESDGDGGEEYRRF